MNIREAIYFLLVIFVAKVSVFGQCMSYPVSLEERVAESQHIIIGEVIEQSSFLDPVTSHVMTAHRVRVVAWLKNGLGNSEVIIITEGGVLEDIATLVYPSLQVQADHEYLFFLDNSGHAIEHPAWKIRYPSTIQTITYAGAQGGIIKQRGLYRDLHAEPVRDEIHYVQRIEQLTGQKAKTPDGAPFIPRPFQDDDSLQSRSVSISSFGPNPTIAGSINTQEFLTISGSNLGTGGNILYRNADDGGNTTITAQIASDYPSWSSNQIISKVPSNAGSGVFQVQVAGGGNFNSPTSLTILYSLITINNIFFNWPTETRQRPKLVNLNGSGGYTFSYNTNFNSNNAAVAAFERALDSWKCNTGVNFITGGSTTATVANDGMNVISFNSSLSSGTLGVTRTTFVANGTTACSQANTVWRIADIDIEFRTTPGSLSWNFGTGNANTSQFDFESVALHELGHAIGLGHIINTGGIMHFAIGNGQTKRNLSENDINGGLDMVNYSSTLCFNPAGVNGPMQQQFPTSCFLQADLIQLDASRLSEDKILINWKALETDNQGFTLERSIDGNQFTPLDFIDSQGDGEHTYEFLDRVEKGAGFYYRLQSISLDGTKKVLGTRFVAGTASYTPSLIWNGQALQILGDPTNVYQIEVYSLDGILRLKTQANGGESLPTQLPLGIYPYRIISKGQIWGDKLFLNR